MLPVSGAEQLNGSGPIGERPMTSQIDRVFQFVSASGNSRLGRNRFQRPCAFARVLQLLHDAARPSASGMRVELLLEHVLGGIDVLLHERGRRGRGGLARGRAGTAWCSPQQRAIETAARPRRALGEVMNPRRRTCVSIIVTRLKSGRPCTPSSCRRRREAGSPADRRIDPSGRSAPLRRRSAFGAPSASSS